MTTITGPRPLDVEDIDFAFDDPHDLVDRLAVLRSSKPAAWVRYMGEPTLLLTSHDLVSKAFRDEEHFPSYGFYAIWGAPVMGKTLQCMTGDEHRVNRALVSPAFRARLMPDYVGPILEPVANELVDRFVDRGEAELVTEFTKQFPFSVITRLLALPPSADGDFQKWALGLISYPWDPEGALAASAEFTSYLAPLVGERRANPGPDLVSQLTTEEVEGQRLSDEEIFSFIRLLFPAGADTTYLALGNTLLALLTHPDELATVLTDPATECRWAAEESLRWQPPVGFLTRRTQHEVEWESMTVPDQTYVLMSAIGANRDPSVFDDPNRFDVRRHPEQILSFGYGLHFCLGAHLARAEMEVALRVLLERLPNLELTEPDELRVAGTIMRGPERLPVRFG